MKYKAIVCDVDGTLLAPSEVPSPALDPKLAETIQKVRDQGVYFSIATGRSLEWIEEILKNLHLTEPIILDNGARVYDCGKKKYVWESLIPKVEAQKVFTILAKYSDLRLYILDDGKRCDSVNQIKKWKISKILVLGITPEKSLEIHNALRHLTTLTTLRSISGHDPIMESIHVTNGTATKQYGVYEVAKILNISPNEMIGIGDSYNDFPLLSACGLKVAVGNAVDEIKEIADYIAPNYDKDGVINVLEKFILNPDANK